MRVSREVRALLSILVGVGILGLYLQLSERNQSEAARVIVSCRDALLNGPYGLMTRNGMPLPTDLGVYESTRFTLTADTFVFDGRGRLENRTVSLSADTLRPNILDTLQVRVSTRSQYSVAWDASSKVCRVAVDSAHYRGALAGWVDSAMLTLTGTNSQYKQDTWTFLKAGR